MVYSYKRKSNRGSWEEKDMEAALAAVQESGESILNASKSFNVPYGTLHRHLKKGTAVKCLGRFQPVFTKVQELELKEYLLKMDSVFFGLTKKEFLELVFEFAEANKIPHPFKKLSAGDDWFKGFKERNPDITLRTPEPTSVARARGFNKPQVNRFYDLYSEILEKYKINATTLYNVDETGIHTTTNRPPKILSSTGKKQVGVISSSERGQLTTIIGCCNAAGQFLPPYFIFARKKMVDRLLDGSPPGSEATCTDNGWINGPVFLQWLQYFVHQVRPSPEKTILLLMDNHISHKYYPALEFARENNVVFLSFPPHTTNKLQPLDRAVYGPFKTFFEQEINTFQKAHPGRIVNQLDIARLVTPAFLKSASAKNAVHGFSSTGLWPLNRNTFGEEDFAPATVTDRPPPLDEPVPSHDQVARNKSPRSSCRDQVATTQLGLPGSSCQDQVVSFPDTSKQFLEDKETSSSTSPFQLRPLKPYETRNDKRKRKCQRSEILTSTPQKDVQKMCYVKSLQQTARDKKTSSKVVKKTAKKPRILFAEIEENQDDTRCCVCTEKFADSAGQGQWIQCGDCQDWAHEVCTSYTGVGAYYCDLCQE